MTTSLLFFLPIFLIVANLVILLAYFLKIPIGIWYCIVTSLLTLLLFWKAKIVNFRFPLSILLTFTVLVVILILPSLHFSGKRLGLANGGVDSGVHLSIAKQILINRALIWNLENDIVLKAEKGYPFGSHIALLMPSLLLPKNISKQTANIIIFDNFTILNVLVFAIVVTLILLLAKERGVAINKWSNLIKICLLVIVTLEMLGHNFSSFWAQSVATMFLLTFIYLAENIGENKWRLILTLLSGVMVSWSWTLMLPVVILVSLQIIKNNSHLLGRSKFVLVFVLLLHFVPAIPIIFALGVNHINSWGGTDTKNFNQIVFWISFLMTLKYLFAAEGNTNKERSIYLKGLLISNIGLIILVWIFQMVTNGQENYYYFKLYQFLFIPLIILSGRELDLNIAKYDGFIHTTGNKVVVVLFSVFLLIYFYPGSLIDDLYRGKLFYPDAHHYNTILALQEKYQDQKVRVLHIDQDFFGKYFRRALLLDTPHLLNLDESVTSKKSDQKTSLEKVGMWKSQLAPKGEKLVIFDAFSSIGQNCFLSLVQYAKRNNIDIYPDIDLQKMTQDCGSDQSLSQ